jgi:hypothetical protein
MFQSPRPPPEEQGCFTQLAPRTARLLAAADRWGLVPQTEKDASFVGQILVNPKSRVDDPDGAGE